MAGWLAGYPRPGSRPRSGRAAGCRNPGDVRPVGEGVSELRIDYGPGYRVYFRMQGRTIVVLLAGGDKRTQSQDTSRRRCASHETCRWTP